MGFLLIVRLCLAVVFAIAAMTKLADQAGTRQALRSFGVSSRLAPTLAIALPLAEAGIAIALVPPASAAWSAAIAFALLGAFTVVIAEAVRSGRRPECHCFGALHSEPVGAGTLVRNGLLMVLAAATVAEGLWGDPVSVAGWLDGLAPGERTAVLIGVPALGLIAGLTVFSFALLRQNGRLLLRVDELEEVIGAGAGRDREPGLPIGTPAPNFSATTPDGELADLDALRVPDRLALLAFVDPDCEPCRELLPRLARWQDDHRARLTIGVVTAGDPAGARALREEYRLERVIVQEEREIAEAYRAYGTPTATLMYADGRIARPLARGVTQIEALVAEATTPNGDGGASVRRAAVAATAGAATLAVLNGRGTDSARAASSDPEIQAINAAIDAADAGLTARAKAAAARFDKLTGGLAGKRAYKRKVRKARAATESLLAAQTALRGQIAAMTPTGTQGQKAQGTVIEALDLLISVESLVSASLTGNNKRRVRQAKQANKTYGDAIQKAIDAAFLLGR